MKPFGFLLSVSLCLVAFGPSALAQNQQSFVSGAGDDSNPCTQASPCRTFTEALFQTNLGGEVYVMDTASYLPFSITKAVTINAPQGVVAGISVSSQTGDGIDILGVPGEVVLRGLSIYNQGSTGNGISFAQSGTLFVENCIINGFGSASGIYSNSGSLEVKDSVIRENHIGIQVAASSSRGYANVDRVRLEANGIGLQTNVGGMATVKNSLISDGTSGLQAFSTGQLHTTAELNVEDCVISNNNGYGVAAISDGNGITTVRVSNSTVTNNTYGFAAVGTPAVFLSRGNNTVEGNTVATTGTIGSFASR